MPDLVIRGGTLVRPDGRVNADIRIEGERIVEIGPDLSGAKTEIDARGLHVFPGLIDVHLHFNEPGRTGWEGGETGSRALAAGGGTLFFDMPLNSTPCTLSAHEVERKRAALSAASIADFAIWGGLVPGSIGEMAGMADKGVVGFKAFMCDSGLPEFPPVDVETLERGMREAARLGLPVAVHAESEALIRHLTEGSGASAADFVRSRPVEAEVEAIEQALDCAAETGASLHIVHVSSGSGVAAALTGRNRGIDVSIETCPHYLAFTEHDLERLDVGGKCAPPLRSFQEHVSLRRFLLDGVIDIVASDHSPCDPSLKRRGDFRTSWGGIAGIQSTLAVLTARGPDGRRLRFEDLSALVSQNPAERFRIAAKGAIAEGFDADLLLLNPSQSYTLEGSDLFQRHKISPYIGMEFTGRVVRTIRRGETIFVDGKIVAVTRGKHICPTF